MNSRSRLDCPSLALVRCAVLIGGLIGVSVQSAPPATLPGLFAETATRGAPAALSPAEDAELARRIADEAIAARRQMVLRAVAADPSSSFARKNPKNQHAIVAGRLWLDPHDKPSLDYIAKVAAVPDAFAYHGLASLFARFGNDWDPALVEAVRRGVLDWKGFLGGGTENQVAMERAAGIIFGERFPDARFHYGLTGRQLLDECRTYAGKYGRAVYAGSMAEYLSPIYLATNMAAWLIPAEHARDDTARLASQAVLDWMLTDLALNSFAGATVPPLQREKGLLTGTYQRTYPVQNTQWFLWMLFDQGQPGNDGAHFPAGHEPYKPPAAYCALSNYLPHPVIRNLAVRRVATPYMVLQARSGWGHVESTMVNTYGKRAATAQGGPAAADPRWQFRSAYYARDYAIGAGYFPTAPDDPMTHSAVPFGVWWTSAHENNFLLVAHPYWYTERPGDEGEAPVGDEDWIGINPFCRMVHWENAAVLLYDLPATDPYVDLPERGSAKFYSKRTGKVVQSVFVYVPETVDERIQTEAGFFIREGDVYLGVRPLVSGAAWVPSTRAGFVRIRIPGPVTGAVIEVGDRGQYGSFQQFQAKVAAARLDVSHLTAKKTVEYGASSGRRLRVTSVPGTWLPAATVDDVKLDFRQWPITLSPYVTCEGRVLNVNDGRNGFSIDWRGDWPVYTYYDLRDGRRVETGRRFIRDGKLVNATP